MIQGLLRLLGVKTTAQVEEEMEVDPTIRAARVQLERADRILEELERLEGVKIIRDRPKRPTHQKAIRSHP